MLVAASLLCLIHVCTLATDHEPADAGKVVISGTVPDEASRAAVLGRLREVYGAENIVDRLEVGGVVPPPNWTEYMTKILGPGLKQVSNGQLRINGTQIAIRGNVGNEAARQQVASDMATALNPTYSIDNALVVVAQNAQHRLDDTLSNRTIEFETGSAMLTPKGQAILDEMLVVIKELGMPRLQIIGHTDSIGTLFRGTHLEMNARLTPPLGKAYCQIKSELLQFIFSGGTSRRAIGGPNPSNPKNSSIEFLHEPIHCFILPVFDVPTFAASISQYRNASYWAARRPIGLLQKLSLPSVP